MKTLMEIVIDSFLNPTLESLFEKKYCFTKKNDWKLPSDILQTEECWNIKSLYLMKQKLNSTKSLLNDKGEDWHDHTAWINKAALVIKTIKQLVHPELLTQAWCKFYEILCSYDIIPNHTTKIRTLHLCEAPGAFISALNYYLCLRYPSSDWKWTANTLNPYYEGHDIRSVVVDDRFLFPTLKNWYFGEDDTGDITDLNYIEDISNLVEEFQYFDLVTADGSIDCLNAPGEQELVVSKLHFAEILVALKSLRHLGCLVIKKFTFFESITICELFLLNCIFEQVHVFKPCTSRASNSEVYVICIGFNKSEALTNLLDRFKNEFKNKNALPCFPQSAIPNSFIDQVEECMKLFTDLQINAIKENIALYENKSSIDAERLHKLKEACAEEFMKKYSVQSCPLYESSKLYSSKRRVLTSFSDKTTKNHKSLYFQAVGDTFNNIIKSASMVWQEKLLDVEYRINMCFPSNNKRPLEVIEWHFPTKEIRNRMKSKNYQNWIKLGKKVEHIQNSKFGYPLLLHLWNRVAHETIVDVHLHIAAECYWNIDILVDALDNTEESSYILPVTLDKCYENDPLLLHLRKVFDIHQIYQLNMTFSEEKHSARNKIIYINTTEWIVSLHQEVFIKKHVTDILNVSLKFLAKNDSLILCVQSVLTRYMAGLLFLVISLFEKFTVILPEDCALANVGQLWIFKNFQNPKWKDKVIHHLAAAKELISSEKRDVLQIVPMTSLCGGAFYTYLRDINNKHLLQRIHNFISTEKCKIENIICK